MSKRRIVPDVSFAMSLVGKLADTLSMLAQDPGDAALGPVPDSPALKERSLLPPSLDPMNAHYQAALLHEVSGDNVFAFTKLFRGPVPTIAPWNCVRAALEASAIAAWLADPGIDPVERVARSLAFRREGSIQQKKLAATQRVDPSIRRIEARLKHLDDSLIELQGLRSSSPNRARVTTKMPSTTDLVRDLLEKEADYRILSAVAHAHQWALQQMSFQVIREGGQVRLERKLEPAVVVYLCMLSASAYALPLEYLLHQFGWQSPTLHRALSVVKEIAAEPVRISPKPR